MPTLRLLDDILGQRSKVGVLRVLFQQDGLGGREVARRAALSPRAAHAALRDLTKAGVVVRKVAGSSHLFSINRSRHIVTHGSLARLFSEERLVFSAIAERLSRWLGAKRAVTIAIFGSTARGESSPGSDLDILLILKDGPGASETKDLLAEKDREFFDLFGMHLSPYVIGGATFADRFDKKDKLIEEMVREAWVIAGKPLAELLADEPR